MSKARHRATSNEGDKLSRWPEYFRHYEFTSFSMAIAHEKFIRTIIDFVPRSESILEVGFGSGMISLLLADMGYRVTGIDIDPELVAQLEAKRKGFSNLTLLEADMFNLPFENDSFYAVIHQGVLEHFSDDEIRRALLEQRRVSSRFIIFDVPNSRGRVPTNVEGKLDYRGISRHRWRTFIEECGLSIKYEYGKGGASGIVRQSLHALTPFIFHLWDTRRTNSIFNLLGRWLGAESGFVAEKT